LAGFPSAVQQSGGGRPVGLVLCGAGSREGVAVGLACSPSQISKKVIKHPQMMYIEWVCGGIWSGAAGSAPPCALAFPG
jgi:hypothetical protein